MEVRRHLRGPRQSPTSIAAERVEEPVQNQPVRERLSYQHVQARLGQGKRQGQVQALSAHRLACHCRPEQACHGDAIISRFEFFFPQAYCVGQSLGPPSAEAVRVVAAARMMRADDSGDWDSFSSPYKGWPGIDEPMQVGRRGIADGAPLLSPGRWPQTRPGPECQLASGNRQRHGHPDLLHKCAHQKWIRRHRVVRVGRGHGRPRVKLPRIPPLFKRRENDSSHPSAYRRSSSRQQRWRVSSGTLTAQPSTWRMQSWWCSKTQIAKKQAFYVSLGAAQRKLGKGITVASLGGTKDDGTPVARVVFDGTHGVNINQAIKVRDQGAAPGAPNVKRAMKDKADVQAALFGLVEDIEGAHNLVPVREEDGRHQCCRVEEDAGLYLQTVGTFGVGSAAYYWERAAWTLKLRSSSYERQHVVVHQHVASVVGILIAWKSVRDGTVDVEWIGQYSAFGSVDPKLRQVVGKWSNRMREEGASANTAVVEWIAS